MQDEKLGEAKVLTVTLEIILRDFLVDILRGRAKSSRIRIVNA